MLHKKKILKETTFFLANRITRHSLTSRFSSIFESLQKFVQGLSILSRGTLEEKLCWTFQLYDINSDGHITKEEMNDIVTAIYNLMGHPVEEKIDEDRIKTKVDRIFDVSIQALSRSRYGRGICGTSQPIQSLTNFNWWIIFWRSKNATAILMEKKKYVSIFSSFFFFTDATQIFKDPERVHSEICFQCHLGNVVDTVLLLTSSYPWYYYGRNPMKYMSEEL